MWARNKEKGTRKQNNMSLERKEWRRNKNNNRGVNKGNKDVWRNKRLMDTQTEKRKEWKRKKEIINKKTEELMKEQKNKRRKDVEIIFLIVPLFTPGNHWPDSTSSNWHISVQELRSECMGFHSATTEVTGSPEYWMAYMKNVAYWP